MMKIGQSAGKSYAYILGVYLGDGCVTHSGDGYPLFRLNTIDEDFALAVKKALKDLVDNPVSISCHAVKKSSRPNWALCCCSTELSRHLVDVTDGKKKIPDVVSGWDRGMKISFIEGLMDSEGYVAADNRFETARRFFMGFKSCDVWFHDFVALLDEVGIAHGKVTEEKPRREGYKIPRRIYIKIQSFHDSGARFNIARKQNRVNEFIDNPAYTQRKIGRRLPSETTRRSA